MADSEGVFGGNGSVNWEIEAENPRNTPDHRPNPRPNSPNRWRQAGEDALPPNTGRFTISIEVPEDVNDAFFKEFQLANARGGRIQFSIPIRQYHRDQIKISWPG